MERPQPSAATTSGPPYLTCSQVAEMLQISEKTVCRWIAADPTMPVLKVGSVTRFPRERLERWLRARESGPGRARQSRKLTRGAPEILDSTRNGKPSAPVMGHAMGHEGQESTP